MFAIRLVPEKTSIDFVGLRRIAFLLSAILIIGSIAVGVTRGLNFGIDFAGGVMLEVKTSGPADLAKMRSALAGKGLGDVSLQEFGEPDDVLIRVQRQDEDSGQAAVVEKVRQILTEEVDPQISFRRAEYVGPKVGNELIEAGALAVLLALGAMLVYIWFRFEWQFGVGAVVALFHDVIATIGVFSLTGIEFNLASVAAVLTIVGYSLNDTVVIYDRVRESLRKFKNIPLKDILNRSINDTLGRTMMTSLTTLIALLALYILGGEVIRGFAFAMIFGVVVGTYSSVFVAVPVLILLGVESRQRGRKASDDDTAVAEGGTANPS